MGEEVPGANGLTRLWLFMLPLGDLATLFGVLGDSEKEAEDYLQSVRDRNALVQECLKQERELEFPRLVRVEVMRNGTTQTAFKIEGYDQEFMKLVSLLRPADFDKRSPEEQWAIDKSLGILDWEGRRPRGN